MLARSFLFFADPAANFNRAALQDGIDTKCNLFCMAGNREAPADAFYALVEPHGA